MLSSFNPRLHKWSAASADHSSNTHILQRLFFSLPKVNGDLENILISGNFSQFSTVINPGVLKTSRIPKPRIVTARSNPLLDSKIFLKFSMANAWKRNQTTKVLTAKNLLLFVSTSLVLMGFLYLSTQTPTKNTRSIDKNANVDSIYARPIKQFDCYSAPQGRPVFANTVEGLKFPFLYSLSDFGNLPDKPHKNIVRMLKGKPFRRPDISATVQEVLEKMRGEKRQGFFVDVGANVGMATFAAAVMGFKVLAFEPVFDNLQRICDGIYFNRVGDLVEVFEAVASDHNGNITFHKLVGRLDNSAVSAVGAKMAFKSNEEIALQIRSVILDEIIRDSDPVLLLKIDVQGWEYHVLKGASRLLSRKQSEAPYLIYEEDERLLQASNSSAQEIRQFLNTLGYNQCTQHGTDAHCTKTD